MTNEIIRAGFPKSQPVCYNEIPGANLVPKTEKDVHHLERDAQSSPPVAPDVSERGVLSSIGGSGLAGSDLPKGRPPLTSRRRRRPLGRSKLTPVRTRQPRV